MRLFNDAFSTACVNLNNVTHIEKVEAVVDCRLQTGRCNGVRLPSQNWSLGSTVLYPVIAMWTSE